MSLISELRGQGLVVGQQSAALDVRTWARVSALSSLVISAPLTSPGPIMMQYALPLLALTTSVKTQSKSIFIHTFGLSKKTALSNGCLYVVSQSS